MTIALIIVIQPLVSKALLLFLGNGMSAPHLRYEIMFKRPIELCLPVYGAGRELRRAEWTNMGTTAP